MCVVDYEDGSRIIENIPMYYQGDTGTCAQACVTSVLNYWGINVSYEEVIANTNPTMMGGMSVEQMIWYFRNNGLRARHYSATLSQLRSLIDRGLPAIITYDDYQSNHVIIANGYNDYEEKLFYIDSMHQDLLEKSYTSFLRMWTSRRLDSTGKMGGTILSNALIEITN